MTNPKPVNAYEIEVLADELGSLAIARASKYQDSAVFATIALSHAILAIIEREFATSPRVAQQMRESLGTSIASNTARSV